MVSQRPVLGIKTWVAGDIVTAGDLNQQGRDHINFLNDRRPHAIAESRVLTGVTAQSISNDSWTSVTLNTARRDTEGGFNSSGVYTVGVSGWYYVSGCVVFSVNGTNQRGVRFGINNGPAMSGAVIYNPDAGIACGVSMSRMMPLVAGQLLTLQCWQDSGGALALNYVEPEVSYMDLIFMSQFYSYSA